MDLIPVILSGGSGTRMWPVSRSNNPKPFMKLPDGQSLLEKTLFRALKLTSSGQVLTVTGVRHFDATRNVYRDVGVDEQYRGVFLNRDAKCDVDRVERLAVTR